MEGEPVVLAQQRRPHLQDRLRPGGDSQADPGRVTVRRLNRVEYHNTIRDLLGVDYDTRAEFPPDDTGNGFDNNGDVLTLSSAFRPPTPQTPPVPIFAGGSAVVGVTSYAAPFGFGGEINLLGDAVTLPAPPGEMLNEHVTVTAPFRLTGELQGWLIVARDAKMQFALPLVGHGTATLELITNPGPNGPAMGFFRIQYVFEK